MSANVESAIFNHIPAWHQQGVVVDDITDMNEAMKLAELDWTVRKQPTFIKVKGKNQETAIKALMRNKPGFENQILGYCTDQYEVLQNKTVFNIIQEFIDTAKYSLEAAGSLAEGKKVWGLMKVEDVELIKGDVLKNYLLFLWGHDNKTAAQIKPTTIRVVCQNTLNCALKEGGSIKIQHSKSIESRLNFVKDVLLTSESSFETQMSIFKRLLDITLTDSRIEEFIEELYGPKEDDGKVAQRNAERRTEFLKQFVLEQKASGLKQFGLKNSAYGVFNALSEANEHYLPGKKIDAGMNILLGKGAQMNNLIQNKLLALTTRVF